MEERCVEKFIDSFGSSSKSETALLINKHHDEIISSAKYD